MKHSITLYGFGTKYIQGKWTLEDVLKKAKAIGCDGIELVSPQMVPGHPNPSQEWIAYFKDLCASYELAPVCYSIYIDSGKHKGRFLTATERFICTLNEMEYAKRLGFSVVRTGAALLPYTMEKLLPYAEELDLHLAIELHGPETPSTPIFQELEALFEEANSPHLGVVLDYSAFASGAPATVLNTIPDDVCLHKELVAQINHLYTTTEISEDELLAKLRQGGGDEVDELIVKKKIFSIPPTAKMGTPYFRTHPDYAGFRRLLKWSKYMHGKFFYVDEELNCPGIDYPSFVKIMKEEGYSGYIASEFEGGFFDPTLDESDQIIRHIAMLEKLWEAA
ncbi:MAG: sugar phosphate isomerase/epimerase [Bifidobacteriaceae bacterium]|jgi:sugar phosphate isomerase/epimerase|nr:sugar phosphate isomerase/epimerase [Bifidobacteriaceae bacterium]